MTTKFINANGVLEIGKLVKIVENNGVYSFFDQYGNKLNLPTDLQPYTPPAQTASDLLANTRANQKATLDFACQQAILSGFQSSALGSTHQYPANPKDQSNLIGAVAQSYDPSNAANWTVPFWCADASGNWSYQPHTASQIRQVMTDGISTRTAMTVKLSQYNNQVDQATTVEGVLKIIWT